MGSDPELIEESDEPSRKADGLDEGDKVLLNDRSRPLTVTGRHEKPVTKTHRRHARKRDHYDIVEMEGNGTNYHLLYRYGSGVGPILRKESEWTEVEENGETRYEYRSGTRIKSIEVTNGGNQ